MYFVSMPYMCAMYEFETHLGLSGCAVLISATHVDAVVLTFTLHASMTHTLYHVLTCK